jgi:uncharacterized protein (TIGR02466 family)
MTDEMLLFGTPVVKVNIGRSLTKEELDCIANIPMGKSVEGDRREVVDGGQNQSESYLVFDDFAEELKDIKTFCEYELNRYMEDIEGVDTDITGLRITNSWLTKLYSQQVHPLHNHRNSHLSGVFYISCWQEDFLAFKDRDRIHDPGLYFPKKKVTPRNAEGVSINVTEGDLIIFPSLTLHQVGETEIRDRDRCSLSFDTWPTYLPSVYPPSNE